MLKKLSFILCLLCSVSWIQAATFTVSNTSGTAVTGSFAKAIADANAAGTGPHTITFSITNSTITSGDYTLYQISNSNITIDASGRNITFSGSYVSPVTYGITLLGGANNITIKGLTFINFSGPGIRITAVNGIKVLGCRFGTAADASSSINSTMAYGVHINGATDVSIGGNTAAERNYFADASSAALYILSSDKVVITGNYFGINSSGNTLYADKNGSSIYLSNCTNSIIGRNATGERNLFAGSTNLEIEMIGFSGYNNIIANNYFGYTATKSAQLTYNNGIKLTNANNNLIMYNSFGGTYATPLDASGTYSGNKLRRNSYESHSGDPNTALMSTNVQQPIIYSASSTIVKGKAAPGDSVEIYYSNSYVKSGLTFITAVKADATGRWTHTASFTAGQYIAVNATNNTNNTTSWFTTTAYSIYTCANTPTVYANNLCKNPNLATAGFYPSGGVGTTNPTNAGLWTTNGTGTFSNGGKFNPSLTKYYPSAADLTAGSVTFHLVTTDTNCVNSSGVYGTTTLIALPPVAVGSDKYSCSSNVFALSATPTYYGNSSYYTNWVSLDAPGNVSFNNTSFDTPTATFSAQGTYRIVRSVGSLPYYCSNTDTLVVTYKPTPTAVGGSLTTISQVPVTYTVPAVTGETLTAYYYTGSVSPASSIVTASTNTVTYVSTGTYSGAASFTYYVQNQCGGTSSLGTVSVNVKNAPPKALNPGVVTSTRGGQNTVVIYIPNYVTDVNNDLNLSSFQIQNIASGATVLYNTPSVGYVTIDYSAPASAADFVDLDSARFIIADNATPPNTTQGKIMIDRERNLSDPSANPDDIVVYDAISPDGDGVNDFLHIVNLSDYANTVTIYDRWGDKVWEGKNYNNTSVRFEGKRNISSVTELPNDTYFFVIKNESKVDNGEKAGLTSGYLVIRRQQ